VSGPDQPAAGVYVYEPSARRSRTPWAGSVWSGTVRPLPASLARSPSVAPAFAVDPACTVTASAAALGVTVTVTVLVAVRPEESFAV
jgi:hypothetical protein